MKDAALLASPLFRGATSEEIAAMLPCLGASPRRFARGERILRAGEPTRYMGLVLTGSVLIEHTDMQGAVTLLGRAEPGDLFAEAYACLGGEPLEVAVLAAADAEVLFLNSVQALSCARPGAAEFTRNLLTILESDPHPEDWPHGPPHHPGQAAQLSVRPGHAGRRAGV